MILSDQTISKINDLLNKQKVLLLGEMHGVQENPLLVEELVNKIRSVKTVGFEYPNEIEPAFNQLPIPTKELLEYPPVQTMMKDGRFSSTHLEVIERLIKSRIQIVCFDPKTPTRDWNERDKGMADIITKYQEKNSDDKILLICGNLHAKTKPFKMATSTKDDKPYDYTPFGSYIKNQVNVKLNYLSGHFYNFGVKDFSATLPHNEQLWEEDNQLYLDIKNATATNQ